MQWIYTTPEVNQPIFDLLEAKVVGGKKATGRPGLDLWHILVLGVVRLGLDCDYDRLEHLANYDSLLRQILGLSPVATAEEKPFHYKTLADNVCLVDAPLLQQINALVAQAGRAVFKKKATAPAEPIRAKADTCVLETDIHYPTDLNLLWDAQRKCAEGLMRLVHRYGLPGWRKAQGWRTQLKGQMIGVTRLLAGGGSNKPARGRAAVQTYVATSYRFEQKFYATRRALPAPADAVELLEREQLDYFHTLMIQLLDLLERRLLQNQTIAHAEKIFSIFEPHTELVKKGKLFPPIEFGHKLLITTDQHELILDYRVMDQPTEVDEAIPLADRLWARYGAGSIASLSFDKGFTREEDRQLLALYIPEVIMPKRGKRTTAEAERESTRRFVALRHQHHAIESDINCLEHHGLNRCLDKGLPGFKRYVGFGVLAYNLHKIGARLLARQALDTGQQQAA